MDLSKRNTAILFMERRSAQTEIPMSIGSVMFISILNALGSYANIPEDPPGISLAMLSVEGTLGSVSVFKLLMGYSH